MNMSQSEEKSFVVYQASAGSGKTYTLAKEYIRLCLMYYPKDPFIYRKILGITFTNKAVNEMKERILLFLEMLSSGEPVDLLKELSEFVDESEIPVRSKEILDLIHHDYSNFSIYTIDSLFQRIIQSFAIDLKIPINHQLELDANTMMSQIVDLILSKLGYDQGVTDAILNFSFSNIEEEKNWHIERELANIGKEIYNETAISHLKKLENLQFEDFDSIVNQINSQIAAIESKIINAAKNACSVILENGVQFADFYQGLKGIGQWFYKRSQGDFSDLSGNSYILKAINEDVWYSSTSKSKEAIEELAPFLKDDYYTIAATEQDYRLLKAIRKNIYPVVLLNEIKRTAEDLKKTDKLIHISEANLSIFESIKNEPVPFVYERIGERYKYIFIDEFQDTSNVQWQNILPLVVEILSSSVFEEESGKVIIFGDAKQAIYRFRGGNVLQFVVLPKLIESDQQNIISKERENMLTYNYKKMFLQKNYRSKKEVVEFNNSFFTYLLANEEGKLKDIYFNSSQDVKEDNTGGAMILSYFLKDTQEEKRYVDFVYEEVYRIVASVQKDNYSYRDIVVLVRGNDFGAEIARDLLKKGIPTVSGESLLLSKNREVNFLVACLYYLVDENNDIARTVILNFISEERGISKEDIFIYSKDSVLFLQVIQQYQYDFDMDMLCRQNLYERVEQLLQIFNLTRESNPFILAFLDVVADFMKTGNNTETRFLDYWKEKENKFSLSNPRGTNAVTIMTIHQSKGLEFPIVIYPHRNKSNRMGEKWVDLKDPIANLSTTILKVGDMKGTVYNELYEEEQQLMFIDDLNIDYVAFTRAKDRLYFIVQEGDKRGDAVKSFLHGHNNIGPVLSEDGAAEYYYFGTPQQLPNKKDESIIQKEHFIQSYISKPISASLSITKHDRFWEKDMLSSTTWWGTQVHNYLAKVYYKKDVESVLQEIQNDITIEANTKKDLQTVIHNVFFNPQSDVLFGSLGNEIKNELELIDASGKSFRIDRLQINDRKCVVFEYKTGKPAEDHRSQINQYDDMLSDAGFEVIDKYLIYIGDDFNVQFNRMEKI